LQVRERAEVMPEWDEIFRSQGRVFRSPHPYIGRLVEVFRENGVWRVLDLGCGTGRHTIHLARSGFEMYALDSSANALTQTEQWLQEEGLTAETTLQRMEAGLPYPDDFFDAVLSVQVIHHNMLPQILETIAEIDRVLRPGGVIFVSVPVLRDGPVPAEVDWHLRPVEPRTFIPERGPEAGIPHHYFTEDELRKVFGGYRNIEISIDEIGHRCFLAIRAE
jgi:SAM-dependent methyltransferase